MFGQVGYEYCVWIIIVYIKCFAKYGINIVDNECYQGVYRVDNECDRGVYTICGLGYQRPDRGHPKKILGQRIARGWPPPGAGGVAIPLVTRG